MPELEKKYLNMFKELYLKKEGKDLPAVDIVAKFNKLITLVKNTYLPVQRSEKEKLEKLIWQTTNTKK
jgi:hypothetical protein